MYFQDLWGCLNASEFLLMSMGLTSNSALMNTELSWSVHLVCLRILQIFQRRNFILYVLIPPLQLLHRDTKKMMSNISWYLWSATEESGIPMLQGTFANGQSSPEFCDNSPAKQRSSSFGQDDPNHLNVRKKVFPFSTTICPPLPVILDIKIYPLEESKTLWSPLSPWSPITYSKFALEYVFSRWQLQSITWLNFSVIQFSL